MKLKTALSVFLVLVLLLCAGCANKKSSSDDTELPDLPSSSDPTPSATEETPVDPVGTADAEEPEDADDVFVPDGNVNPLTGLCDGVSDEALASRPVAIMVSNIITSLPQWGVSDADILIEMLAEGRITRFMALYQDPLKIDHIASIRSARPYFIDMAQSFGAVYIHFGGSVPAYDAIAARSDLVHIDGIKGNWEGTTFFRDPERKARLGSEHSVYTTGRLLQEGLDSLNKDLSLSTHPSAFNFSNNSTHSASGGAPGKTVRIPFSETHTPWFEYDEQSGKYLRYEYNAAQMDGWTKQQIAVKNVLLLRMDTSSVPGSDLGLIEIDTTDRGEGYYFCEGRYVDIIWEKDSYNGEIRFYTTDGRDVSFARGQTFISCILRTAELTIE